MTIYARAASYRYMCTVRRGGGGCYPRRVGEGSRGWKVHEEEGGMQAEVGTNAESFNEFE